MSPMIDGHYFPEKNSGMTLVDAYYVPDEEADAYRARREHLAERLSELFREFCVTVRRDFAGSQDGEAITGCDASGELVILVHLDPDEVDYCLKAERKGRLLEAVLEMNEISFRRYRELRREAGIVRQREQRAQA